MESLINDWDPSDQSTTRIFDRKSGNHAVFGSAGAAPAFENTYGPMVQFSGGQVAQIADSTLTFYAKETFIVVVRPELFTGSQYYFDGLGATVGGRRIMISNGKEPRVAFQSINGTPTTLVEVLAFHFAGVSQLAAIGYRTVPGLFQFLLNGVVVAYTQYDPTSFQWGQTADNKYAFGQNARAVANNLTAKIGRAMRFADWLPDADVKRTQRKLRYTYPLLPSIP